MQFRTILEPHKAAFDLNYHTPILTVGSCFAENIGNRLSDLRFPININPFGILFNPISVADCLNYLMTETIFTENDIFENNGLWHSWLHHGRFSSPEKDKILRGVNDSLLEARQFFKTANRLIITLGTANVFVENTSNKVVANCHKVSLSMPKALLWRGTPTEQYFNKKRLSVTEIVESLSIVFSKIKTQNTDMQVIITVSPIRHIRDGLLENQRSKATLLLAIEEIMKQFPNIHYFPAYEIVMDDLRDYRFYEADMIHPNSQAIAYIWQFFSETFFLNETKIIAEEVRKVNLMQQHRPLHPDTEGYKQFVDNLKKRTGDLEKKYPYLRF